MKDLIERIEAICSELGFRIIDREESEELYQSSLLQNDEICGSLFVEKDSNFLEIAYTYTFDVEEENFLKSHLESMMNICYEYGNYFNIMKGEDEINFSIFTKVYFSGLNVESMQDTFDDFIACNHEIIEIFGLDEDESLSGFDDIQN
ncbi:MAG: hypothetical protein KAS61_03220 [Spirochaetes bacterium]|nr:hypothetical protein [Spirochaetota bacterium]